MATFSIGGLASGIDYNSMIDQIMKLERQPITRLEAKKTDYNRKISIYGELSSKLAALKKAADALRTASNFHSRKASSGDDTLFDATAGSSAAEGNYSITVTDLAQAHRIASSPVGERTSVVSTGTGNFSFTVGGGEVTTVVVSSTTTLTDLRDAINGENGDAEASVIFDGTGYRLVLTAGDSGGSNTIAVTENATTLGLPSGPVSGGTTLQSPQDAAFSIDTFAMTRSSNTVGDAIEGVTISLKKGGTATLSVTNDTAAIREKIDAFVAAYNDVASLVATNALYSTATRTGGPLTGESTAREIVNGLKRILGSRVEGLPEDLRVLAQIGIKTEKDGKLKVDGGTLSDKLSSDLEGVADLFSADGGVAASIYDYADEATDTITGSIGYRTKGLNKLVSGISDDILKIETRLEKEEEDLRTRFSKLEALLSTLSSQSAFLNSLVLRE